MKSIVFYSWQSDLPNSTNRGFIEKALENAVQRLCSDQSIIVEPVVDRDTAGVPGAPDISSTIFSKIDQAHVFVCDVSIINQNAESRLTPNPNVLIELGYTEKVLGSKRIIMVLNTAFGGPEQLPFDLRMRRVITYQMAPDNAERSTERKELEKKLESALRTIFDQTERELKDAVSNTSSLGEQARASIESSQPNRIALVRKFINWMAFELEKLAPEFPGLQSETELDEILIEAIEATDRIVIEFAQLSDVTASIGDKDVARILYDGFDNFLNHYNPPRNFSGSFNSTNADFYKFLGHEFFVIFFSFLIAQDQWELIADLLENDFYVENNPRGGSVLIPFNEISDYVKLLEYRNNRLGKNRISLHADILNERHTTGEIGKAVPMRQFLDADYFLFMREGLDWRPWSSLYMGGQIPKYLVKAQKTRFANRLLAPLKVENLDNFKELMANRIQELPQLFRKSISFRALEYFDIKSIGSQ